MQQQYRHGRHPGGLKLSWPWACVALVFTIALMTYDFGWTPLGLGLSEKHRATAAVGRLNSIITIAEAREQQREFCKRLDIKNMPQTLQVPWSPLALNKGSTQFTLKDHLRSNAYGLSSLYRQYVYSTQDVVSEVMLDRGAWEPGEMHNLVEALIAFAEDRGLQRNDVYFVDIGANVGSFTLGVAAYGFSVLAVEPMHANALALRHSMCINPHLKVNITLLHHGLGSREQHCALGSIAANVGDGTVFCGGEVPSKFEKRQDLDIYRLDDVLEGELQELEGRVGAVKVDVEGFELEVLQGGMRFFRTVKPPSVMMECNDGMMTRATGSPAAKLLTEMSQLGYTVREKGFTGREVVEDKLPTWEQPNIDNFYFTLKQNT